MRFARLALLFLLLWTPTLVADSHSATPAGPTPDQAYQQLLDGHGRYATNARTLPHQDDNRRCETTSGGQHPVAAVLSCADSRVPPELLFDQGIGDLFVIRVAGNVAAADELGTLEYGVEHLNIPLIVVLGHTKCGAVTAVVDGAHAEGNLAELLAPIAPAAARARRQNPAFKGPQLVGSAIQENVRQSINDLSARSPVLAKAISSGRVKVVGGVYDIHGGQIAWLPSVSLAAVEPAPTVSPETHAHAEPAAHGEAAHDEKPHTLPAAPEPASHNEHPAPHAARAAKPAAVEAPHAAVDMSDDAPAGSVTPHGKPARPAAKPVSPARHDDAAEEPHTSHGPTAAAHDEVDLHEPNVAPTKTPQTAKPEIASARLSLLDNWPILTGVAVASTLIGAAITRFAPKQSA